MHKMTPITTEYIRRLSILTLLAFFAWMFFYSPSDIYEIQIEDFAKSYKYKVKKGSIDSFETTLDDYIAKEMKGPYGWSNRKQNIVEVEGEFRDFINRVLNVHKGGSKDTFIIERRSPDTFWSSNSYFFRSYELPQNFLSQIFSKHPDYLMSKSEDGQKSYYKLYKVERVFSLDDAPTFIAHPLRMYAYILIVTSLLIYFIIPKTRVPEGAASYANLNAVYLPDALSFFLWTGAWMFFFLPDDSAPMFVRYFFLLFFVIFAFALILPTVKYASNWYLFTENTFEWSGRGGVGRVLLDDIISVEPYTRALPKWVAPLIILFGRGSPGPTGWGLIAGTATPEIGMKITTKLGKQIKVMANYLQSDTNFTRRFHALEKKLDHSSDKTNS